MHICWDYLNQTTGEWSPNLDCFINRFDAHRDRLQNIFFNYAVLLRAVGKLRHYAPLYTFCSGEPTQNQATKHKFLKLANAIPEVGIFDETTMFQDDMSVLKEEFRNRFRNVSRVMDCVGCDKCRLWGKVQTQGYGTALKILFEFDENKDLHENPPLRRTELVALVNTLNRVSHSLQALRGFQRMWEDRNRTMAIEAGEIPQIPKPKKVKEKKEPRPQEPLWDIFKQELNIVYQTFIFVIKSWINLPKMLYTMASSEIGRFFDGILGRQARERVYEWRRNAGPPKTEL